MLGAHVQPLSSPSTKPQVLAFEASLGRKLDVDNVYPGFVWPIGFAARAHWDISDGRIPMFSWSPRIGSAGCATLADVEHGKYDTQLGSEAATIRSLRSTVWLRLFFEPTVTLAEQCANPARDSKLYIAAYRHVVDVFRADGVTNVKWIWALDSTEFAKGLQQTWYPGADVVDMVAEDPYNATNTQKPFSAAVCSTHLSKPFAITETGAFPAEQATWLGNVKHACPGLSAFIYFEAIGTSGQSYVLGKDGLAAFKGIGQ